MGDNNQKFEPIGNKIIHGAGQSLSQFKKYWEITKEYKPLLYMEYIKIGEIKEKLSLKIKSLCSINTKLYLQLGLNLKPRNIKEECKGIANGGYDEEILFLIQTLKDFKNPVFLRIGYECNDPTHAYNPKDFIDAWRYITKKIKEHTAENIATVWSVCTAFNRDINEVMVYYPGDDYVDWFGDDLFGVKHFTDANNPKIITEDFCRESEKHKKPLMICESSAARVGVLNGKESWDEWFKPFFKWIHEHPIVKAFCYINWDWAIDWKTPEWGNCRIEENEVVKKMYIKELSKACYIHYKSGGIK